MRKSNKKVLNFCIFFSLGLHILALVFLHNYEFKNSSLRYKIFDTSNNAQISPLLTKEIVDVTFAKNNVQTADCQNNILPSFEKVDNFVKNHLNSLQIKEQDFFKFTQKSINLLTKDHKIEYVNNIFHYKPKINPTQNLGKFLTKNIKNQYIVRNTSDEKSLKRVLTSLEKTNTQIKTNYFLQVDNAQKFNPMFSYLNDLKSIDKKEIAKNTANKKRRINKFESTFLTAPSLEHLKTESLTEDFDIDLAYTPRKDNKGFIFAITLIPKGGKSYKKIKQNFYFLLDRSNVMQKVRLTKTRQAVVSALPFLEKEDTFNILAFDSNFQTLFSNSLPPTHSTINSAKNFLLRQKLGSFFNTTNYHLPLYSLLNFEKKDDEANVILLFTNGENLEKHQNYRILDDWTNHNNGKFSMYTFSLTSDKNTPLLDLFCNMNRGKSSTTATLTGLKRRLQKVLKNIKLPIAKNISFSTYRVSKDQKISFYPSKNELPNLYANEPYVILGKTNTLEDFVLFVQGRNKDNYFNIKKQISFDKANSGDKILEKGWSLQKAYKYYKKYLLQGNTKYLQKAKEIIEPYSIKEAFK